MRSRRFIQCDVFSPIPTQGNPVAVVVDGEGLSDAQMQAFAVWTNLAETTFLLPPEDSTADYRVRIWSPKHEMKFAGHPTLGSCAAWLHAGGVPGISGRVRQACAIGIVDVHIRSEQMSFVAPPVQIRAMSEENRAAICQTLAIPQSSILHAAELDNGPVFQALQLRSADDVLALEGSQVRWPDFKRIGVIGERDDDSECAFEVRMLAPASGMLEDPITGSLNAALAHWMYADGRLNGSTTVAQGTRINRHGRVSIGVNESGDILIGGDTHILIDGTVNL